MRLALSTLTSYCHLKPFIHNKADKTRFPSHHPERWTETVLTLTVMFIKFYSDSQFTRLCVYTQACLQSYQLSLLRFKLNTPSPQLNSECKPEAIEVDIDESTPSFLVLTSYPVSPPSCGQLLSLVTKAWPLSSHSSHVLINGPAERRRRIPRNSQTPRKSRYAQLVYVEWVWILSPP